jgi:hypothetical protein
MRTLILILGFLPLPLWGQDINQPWNEFNNPYNDLNPPWNEITTPYNQMNNPWNEFVRPETEEEYLDEYWIQRFTNE